MSKRRVFDIDFPVTIEEGVVPEKVRENLRRGPMAEAIGENADAVQSRAEAERAIREENDRLAHEHVRLKREGLITDLVPVGTIRTSKLTRDRREAVDPDLDELKASIRAVGLSNPIRVEPTDDGAYELVQGFRRLSAFRALYEETGDDRFAAIPAAIMAQGETLEHLYRKMVDENLVRRDVSFSEMAQLALNYTHDPDTICDDLDTAVGRLYASASRQKRSYIRRFATLLEAVDGALEFAEAIPRNLGLDLEKRLSDDPDFAEVIKSHFAAVPMGTAEKEVQALKVLLSEKKRKKSSGGARVGASAKTTLRYELPEGQVRIAARKGRVELSMDKDFSQYEPAKLEAAVAAFFGVLKGK